jgi:hypothetical protein
MFTQSNVLTSFGSTANELDARPAARARTVAKYGTLTKYGVNFESVNVQPALRSRCTERSLMETNDYSLHANIGVPI